MFGSKSSDPWISKMMMMALVIFGAMTLTHGDIESGTKTFGEPCKTTHGECDFEKKLLICIKEKCACIESTFYGYPKKGSGPDGSTPAPPAGNDTGARSFRSKPQDNHIPATLVWSKEKDNCVVKKNNPCQLDYKDKDIFRTCGKGECKKDPESPQDDLGLCKGGKGGPGEKDKPSACDKETRGNVLVNFGFSFLAILFSID